MNRNYYIVGLVFLVFFVISFLTNILGPIVPALIKDFSLSLTLAGLLPFAFFIAYGVMSIPGGILVERYREKSTMVFSFGVAFLGALLFALFPSFAIALPSLFMIGIGMAILQVAINPLLRVAGGEEHFAFNSVLAQLIFGSASFFSPTVYTYLVTHLSNPNAPRDFIISTLEKIVPSNLPWISLYWLFACISILMILVIGVSRFPRVERKEDERTGAWETHRTLLKNKTVILFFVGIFSYVGTEQGIANWISQFLSTYHGVDPQTVGSATVGRFWLMMTFGCLLGLLLLKLFDSKKILLGFTCAAIVILTTALLGSAETALVAFPLLGFALSVMWSIIFSLALNSVEEHHGSFSGILCTAIIGGALVPLIIGSLGDIFSLRTGMCFLYVTLGYIFSIGIWAKPIITNQTFSFKKKAIES
jgi:FHS family L-fucose permease-like MFS transporter